MPQQQLIDLQILNSLLGLPKNNQLESTLLIINELIIFKNNNQHLKHIMIRLEEEITKFKIKIHRQINQYIQQKVQFLCRDVRHQEVRSYGNKVDLQRQKVVKSYGGIQSLDEFMEKEFDFKFDKIRSRGQKMKVKRIEDLQIVICPAFSLKDKYKQQISENLAKGMQCKKDNYC